MSAELDKQLADLIERCKQTDKCIEQIRTDELRDLISDVNDAALYDYAMLEERIDALERRIEVLERKLNHKGVEQ